MSKRKHQQSKPLTKITKKRNQYGIIQQIGTVIKDIQNTAEVDNKKQQSNNYQNEQQFQDEFDDEFQQQQVWMSASDSQNQNETYKIIQQKQKIKIPIKKKQKRIYNQEKNMQQQVINFKKSAFMGSNKQLQKGQILDFDNSAYDMLHRLNIQWPSLSIDYIYKSSPFDVFPGFQQMNKYPYEIYTIQGSCNNSKNNFVYMNKWTKLHKTKFDDYPDEQENNQIQNPDQQPQLFYQQAITNYDINRIRSLNGAPVVAFWNDTGSNGGQVHLMDLTLNYQKLQNNITSKKPQIVKQIVISFDCSGFALNWNPNKIGELVVGDDKGRITLLQNNQNYTAWTATRTYQYHTSSVQDIIFSPDQDYVFASCSSDGTLQVVDMRVNQSKKSQLKIKAHSSDVNVADWNAIAKHLIVTGGDDAIVKVWDLRMSKNSNSQQLLSFNWHTQPISSIAFQPNQESVIAVASQDNRISIWDMSVENQQQDHEVPNQLMFLHQGQQEVKQIRFHPVYYQMIVSSAIDSINLFKPSFQLPEQDENQLHDEEDLKRQPIKQEDLQKFLGRMSL